MSKEIYVLKNQIHFGTLKTSVPKGTKIVLDREHNKVIINETEHDNISQIEMCIKHGFIIPFDENVQIDTKIKVSPNASKNKQKKYKIEKSDEDSMNEDILVPKKEKKQEVKKEKKKMQVIKQGSVTESRGMQVISSDEQMKQAINSEQKMEVIHADQGKVIAKIPVKKQANKLVDSNVEDVSAIMGEQGKVVKKIGKSNVDNAKNENNNEVKPSKTAGKLVTKKASKESIQKANEKAKARKKKI